MIKILAIDDNNDNLISIKALINEAFPSATIFTALSGDKGIELAIAEDPDVILLDIVMPEMDGFEVCKKIKTDPRLCDIPVVFVTAIKGDKENRIRALEYGAEAFLAKPIDESELIAQIRAMLKIKNANIAKRDETKRLSVLVSERTEQLEQELEQRKRVIEALIKSEERFKHVFESANVGKSITLPTGEINVNKAFCDMLGYSSEELKNKKWQDITFFDDIQITKEIILTLLSGAKTNARFTKRFLHKNGSLIWADVSVAMLYDLQGNPLHFITTVTDISDQINTEEALRKSEETAMALLNGIPESAFLMELDGTVIAANVTVAERLNCSDGDLVGRNIYNLVDSDVAERRQMFEEQVLITKKPVQFEDQRFGKTIDNRVHPIFDKHGNVVRLAIIGIDITEQKKAEMRLRESEMRSRSTFDQSPVGSVIVGLDKRFIRVNPAFCKFIGYSADELIGKTISEITYPEDVEIGMEELKLLIEGKEGSSIVQKRYIRKDGAIVWGELSISLGRDSDNNPLCFLPIIQDITERKKAEEKLILFNRAIEQSTVSIVITNKEGDIEYVNPKVTELTGYTLTDLMGQNPRILQSGEHPIDFYKELWNTILSGNNWQGEFHNKKKNGELYWESATISPILNEKGEISNYVAIKEDITFRKENEQKLLEIQMDLRIKNEEYQVLNLEHNAINAELTESNSRLRKSIDDLEKAKAKAEESDRLKSSFLANMSHEIRTPMNSIMGFASLLPEEESKELIAYYANIIVQNSEQLVHVIDDIVLYSKLQTHLLSFIPTPFNVQNLLSDVKQTFSLPEYQKGVELNIDTEAEVPVWIRSDYEKIRQIFTNLVSNAFKYTKQGSITIGFNSYEDHIEFFVADTGMGVPSDELEKVFERFFRGSNVNKGAIGGTGLGLSIVKELAELLGGRIWVESNTDHNKGKKGSKFYFSIPIYKNV